MTEIELLERIAKIEQSHDDHIMICNERYTNIATSISKFADQMAAFDKKITERGIGLAKGLISLLILLVISLTSYIWIDHVQHKHVEIEVEAGDVRGP